MSGNEYKKGRITGTVKILPPPPAKTLPSKAELQLSKMPGVPLNYTSVQTYRGVPQPSMTNYALQIQLSKIADASVMKPSELNYKKAFTADGTTPEMLEAYKQMERADLYKQGIFRPNYDIDLISIPDEENMKETISRAKQDIDREEAEAKRRIQADYDAVQKDITGLLRQKMQITAAYNRFSGEEKINAQEAFKEAMDQIEIALGASRRRLNTFNGQIGTINTEKKDVLRQLEDAVTGYYEAKKSNDKTFRKYEEDLRSLNQGFIVGRMVGESDEDYKERLLTFERENVEAITQQEAGMYNNMVFKTNLKKVVRLPVHLEEELIKKLGQANLFTINEKWPLYEKKFIETYGKFPVMGERNTLVDFFTNVVPKALIPPPRTPPGSPPRPTRAAPRPPAPPPGAPPRPGAREQFLASTVPSYRALASRPLISTREVGTPSASERLRTAIAGTTASAERIIAGAPRGTDFTDTRQFPNIASLKTYINSKGGRTTSRMTRSELEQIASNL